MNPPEKARDLIELEAGAPEFRNPFWWDTFNEGRLFYPKGFAAALTALGLETTKTLSEGKYLDKALSFIARETAWSTQLIDTKNWTVCAAGQLRSAANEEPMLLTKAAQCIVALYLYARDHGPTPKFDVFQRIKLLPGVYSVVGLSFSALNTLVQEPHASLAAFDVAARALGQGRSRDILWDVSKSQEHVPYAIALLIQEHFNGVNGMTIEIRNAVRPPNRGLYPASSSVEPYGPV